MKLPGNGRMVLGDYPDPTGGTLADSTPPPARPNVLAEGVEFEIVWFPAATAPSLLGDVSRPSTLGGGACPVNLEPEDPNTKDRWSWLG